MTRDEIEQLLKNLHLKRIAEVLDQELLNANEKQLSYEAFLVRLLRAQWHHRQETALSWRVRREAFGRTGLASGLLMKAIQNGYRCLFVRAQDLFDEMYASLADRSTRKLLNQLIRVDVLLIDEFGYLNLHPEQSNIFFKLLEERYRRRPTLITTNLDYEEWHNFLGNKALVEALLSRLRHQCHTIRIDGPSLREPQG